jgi:hypothetical protein
MPGERRPKKRSPDFPPKELKQHEAYSRFKDAIGSEKAGIYAAMEAARARAAKEVNEEEKQTGKFKRPKLLIALKQEQKRLNLLKKEIDWMLSSTLPLPSTPISAPIGTRSFRVERETPRKKSITEHAGRALTPVLGEKPVNIQGKKLGEDPSTTRMMTEEEIDTLVARIRKDAEFRNPMTAADKEMIPVARPKRGWNSRDPVTKNPKVIEARTTPSTGDAPVEKQITPAFPRQERPIVEKRAPEPVPKVTREKSGYDLEDEKFDQKIQEIAINTIASETKPDKEKKEFFEALDSHRGPDFTEAYANKEAALEGYAAGTVTEDQLTYAMMDFYRAKYEGATEFPEVDREMIYEATRRKVDEARRARGATVPAETGTTRPRVPKDYQRDYTVKPGKKKPEAKQRRTPWFRWFAAVATIFGGGVAIGRAVIDNTQERPAVTRTNEDGAGNSSVQETLAGAFQTDRGSTDIEYATDPNYEGDLQNPSTYQPFPAEPGYEPAPRVSATQAAADAEEDTKFVPYVTPSVGELAPLSEETGSAGTGQ